MLSRNFMVVMENNIHQQNWKEYSIFFPKLIYLFRSLNSFFASLLYC